MYSVIALSFFAWVEVRENVAMREVDILIGSNRTTSSEVWARSEATKSSLHELDDMNCLMQILTSLGHSTRLTTGLAHT